MRGKITVLGLTALMILGLSFSTALAGSAVTYLGKTTWTATITDDTQGHVGIQFTVTGGISKVGDEFYLFQGYVTIEGDGPFIMSGSGVMVGTELIFTLSESQKHTDNTWRDGGVMHVTINTSDQSGTFYDIGHDFNTDPGSRNFDSRYTAGDLTLAGPPIQLNGSVPPLQLLLD